MNKANLQHVLLLFTAIVVAAPGIAYAGDCGNGNGGNVKLDIAKYDIRIHPSTVRPRCIESGNTFRIRVLVHGKAPDVPFGEITIVEKHPEKISIRGSGSATDNFITVTVGPPGNATTLDQSEDHEYYIKVENLGMLDPKVRVIDSKERSKDHYRYIALENVLRDELGMDAEEAEALLVAARSSQTD